MTSKKPRILIRTDEATKAALETLAHAERRSVSNYIEVHLQDLIRQNANLLKVSKKEKAK